MRLRVSHAAFVLLFVLLGCASGGSPKRESVTAPGADIAAYETFGWQPASESPGASQPPLSILDASIHDAIRAQLIQKGYREVADAPEFRISFETAAYIKEKVSNPVRIGVGVGSWGGNVGGGVSTSVPVGSEGVVSEQETRLTIRAVDEKSNREVWVGSTAGEIREGSGAAAIEKAVAGTMEKFPAKREE